MTPKSRARAFAEDARHTGIYTLDDLLQRCEVDDVTGCWIWQQTCSARGYPRMWMPGLGKLASASACIGYLKTGETKPRPGLVWRAVCGNPRCMSPEHRQRTTRAKMCSEASLKRSPAANAKIAATKRKQSRLTDEQVEQIKRAEGPHRSIAAFFGCSQSHVQAIRSGESRRPLAARGSSVFSMGVL